MNIPPEIMNKNFDISNNSAHELGCANCLAVSNTLSKRFEIGSIASIATKIWNKISNEIKEAKASYSFCKKN